MNIQYDVFWKMILAFDMGFCFGSIKLSRVIHVLGKVYEIGQYKENIRWTKF